MISYQTIALLVVLVAASALPQGQYGGGNGFGLQQQQQGNFGGNGGGNGGFVGGNGGFNGGQQGGYQGNGGNGGGHGKGMPHEFQYAVQDEYSGNDFGHQENSDGNVVQGVYYVMLPDGRRQTVTYTADHENGYQADVQYEGEARYPEPQQNQGGYGGQGGNQGGFGGQNGGHQGGFGGQHQSQGGFGGQQNGGGYGGQNQG